MNEDSALDRSGDSPRGDFRCRGRDCRHYDECEHTAESCRHGGHGSRGDDEFRGGHGPRGDGEFRGGHGPHHARRPDYLQDDSLRSLLIRSAQIMHHPRAGASQELVLKILARQEELDQRQLQLELDIRPGSLSELVSKLEQKGLVERERSDADRRRVTLRLTDAGRAALAPEDGAAGTSDPFYPLTAEEQETLRGLLTRLLASRDGE